MSHWRVVCKDCIKKHRFEEKSYGILINEDLNCALCCKRKQPRPKGRSFVVELLPLPLSCFYEVPSGGENSQQAEPMASNGFSTLLRH